MVTKSIRLKVIPRHTSCLSKRDYQPYLMAKLKQHEHQQLKMEQVWGKLLPDKTFVPTPTGRHALWYFLEMLDLPPKSEVLIVAYNFYVIVRLVVQKGLTPVFVDIDPDTLCMDPQDLERKITDKSRIVVFVHMFGNPANMAEIDAVCQENDLILFEDCAHAVGTLYGSEPVGRRGDGALFTFGPNKIINTFGGGMLAVSPCLAKNFGPMEHKVSPMESFWDTFSRFINSYLMTPKLYGWTLYPAMMFAWKLYDKGYASFKNLVDASKDDPSYRFNVNSRAPFKHFMKQMHQYQLENLDNNVKRRREIAQRIKTKIRHIEEIGLLNEDKHGCSNLSYFGIYVPDPLAVSKYLVAKGIDTNPQEYADCSSLDQFSDYKSSCEHANYAAKHILRLPSYPWLTDEEADYIATSIETYFK